ncbi:MAG: phosphoglucosamine mutase [Deltaproteobacteria bacterium]|nr:MAG: phosphoglucosamine mutase [Deltaproteobacteria bacterium]
MGKLFGTDGIRGIANEYPMTPEMALKIGRAVANFVKGEKIVIGKDTRISGDMIESAIVSGICSAGANPYLSGVLPTPGVAYLTRSLHAAAGIVISASHNPFFDNGIKLFQAKGFKLSDDEEAEIERLVLAEKTSSTRSPGPETGKIYTLNDACNRYTNFLKSTMPKNYSLKGMKIVLDCSNGATYVVAPDLFSDLGAEVEAISIGPDGKNINEKCGSQHPATLIKKVVQTGADIGLAFDGDGDRLIAVDEKGAAVSGDQILAICAKIIKQNGKLTNNCAVSTVMSNFGLGLAFKEMGINHIITDVGDRYVVNQMLAHGAMIGGEDSGHMIFLENHTTGDGLLTALKLIEAMQVEKRSLSELKNIMTVYPQVLINVKVKNKPDIKNIPEIQEAIQSVENKLKGQGRVLVRYSGTQLKCRVMVEGPSKRETKQHCQQIADIVKEKIGE